MTQHVAGRLVFSPSARAPRRLVAIVGVAIGLYNLVRVIVTITPESICDRDFIQEYLMGRALLTGQDPYTSIDVLSRQLLGHSSVLAHPSPHPPTDALIFLPFAFLDFLAASYLWLALEIVFLALSVYLLSRLISHPISAPMALLFTGISMSWYPVWYELGWGQLNSILLLLLAATWWGLRQDNPILAGLALGMALLIRPVVWPIALLLLLRHYWRALTVCAGFALVGYIVGFFASGLREFTSYVTTIISGSTGLYTDSILNLSVWGLAARTFRGTGSGIAEYVKAPPLVDAPQMASLAPIVAVALILALTCLAIVRARDLDTALSITICSSILISLVAWDHYLVMLFIPLAVVIGRLIDHQFTSQSTNRAMLVGMLLALPASFWVSIGGVLAGVSMSATGAYVLPSWAALPAMIPSLSLVALAALVWGWDDTARRAGVTRQAVRRVMVR